MKQITGNDVIGLPGQNLSYPELRALVGMADGETPTQVANATGLDLVALRHIERDIQAKLGGKSKTHTIARGFVTGVLITRALCLCLMMFMAIDDAGNFTRTRSRTGRTQIVRVRTRTEIAC